MFGTVISKDTVYRYLDEINHPSVKCITNNPNLDYQSKPSTAYKEDGLEDAMRDLIASAEKISPAYYKSPLYSKKMSILGVKAIRDSK